MFHTFFFTVFNSARGNVFQIFHSESSLCPCTLFFFMPLDEIQLAYLTDLSLSSLTIGCFWMEVN